MIDLTPLDVSKKHEDFKRILRGFDPQEVQVFLEVVAERMEELVRENIQLRERSEALQDQVTSQTDREKAVQDALVTAQELRTDIHTQAQREADVVLAESQTEARRLINEADAEVRSMLRDAERRLEKASDALEEMERRRGRFLKAFRQLLEREMDVVEVEESREPLEDRPIDLDLGGPRAVEPESEALAELFGTRETTTGDAVDESAAERPPMDVSVDELAAAYGPGDPADDPSADTQDAGTEGEGAAVDDGPLSLSLDDAGPAPASDDDPDPDQDQWG